MTERTPLDDGLSMPPRWSPHDRTFVSWPAHPSAWRTHLDEAKAEYAEVIRAIARFEPVTVLASPGGKDEVVQACGPEVEVLEAPLDDSWVRDCGPIFVTDGLGGVALTHFGFNAWGGKAFGTDATPRFEHDADVPRVIAEHLGMRRYVAPMIAEGGGLTVDGEGTLITTECVLLNPNRNPGRSKQDVEGVLRDYLGIEKVIWLPFGLAEDMGELGTDGHSDNVVQFIRPGLVLFQVAPDRSNRNWDLVAANRERLEDAIDASGRRLEIVEMPVLPYTREIDGARFPVPYTNFYPVNGGVIAPRLDLVEDEVGHGILRELFPDRDVVGVRSDFQAFGGGGIGCITQQMPAGAPLA